MTCISEDQYANSLMHDPNINFSIPLHRMVSTYVATATTNSASGVVTRIWEAPVEFCSPLCLCDKNV